MIGSQDFFFCARFTSFHTHASFLTVFCFFVFFHSCCSNAQVFGKTLVHELLISFSHTEWYLLLSDSATTRAQKRIRCELGILDKVLVTLYKLNETITVLFNWSMTLTCSCRLYSNDVGMTGKFAPACCTPRLSQLIAVASCLITWYLHLH